MSNRDPRFFLDDILKSIGKIEKYIRDMDYNDFKKDYKTIDAVIRNLEIIGEAAKNIPQDIIEKYSGIDWKGASSMRDRLIHGYFGIDNSIVWQTITTDIPEFKEKIQKIWNDIS